MILYKQMLKPIAQSKPYFCTIISYQPHPALLFACNFLICFFIMIFKKYLIYPKFLFLCLFSYFCKTCVYNFKFVV